MIRISIALVAVALISSCKKDEQGGAVAGKTTEAKPATSAGGATKLPKLGLTIDVPGKVEVEDALVGGEGHTLMGASVGAFTVDVATDKSSLDEAKSDADLYSPKNLNAEQLADGWALTFENTGSMGKNYFVTVQREIHGKTYRCSTMLGEAKQAAAVLAACKTLRQ